MKSSPRDEGEVRDVVPGGDEVACRRRPRMMLGLPRGSNDVAVENDVVAGIRRG